MTLRPRLSPLSRRICISVTLFAGVGACAPASRSGNALPAGPGSATPGSGARNHAPAAENQKDDPDALARSGSLRQDQISVRVAAGDLRIEVTPLAAWVLEATAPDTGKRLHRIARTYRPELARLSREEEPTLFLVSFSSIRPGTNFQPEDLHLISRGLRTRPLAIRAISPGWGTGRLSQQTTSVAVYAYSGTVELSRDLTIAYQGAENSSWSASVTVIEAERARTVGGRMRPNSPEPQIVIPPA